MEAGANTPVLLVPGLNGSGAHHWQTLWAAADPRFRRVEQADWDHPERGAWLGALDRAVAAAGSDVTLVGHSLGCALIAHWSAASARPARAALLVAPPDPRAIELMEEISGFLPVPEARLRFPSLVVASEDDPYCDLPRARSLARGWGSAFVSIGHAGHINSKSGLEDWPRGRALLADLLKGAR